FEAPVGSSTTITFVAMGNKSDTHTPIGATLAQIATLGPNYGLNGNPRSQAFTGYNVDYYTTDFEYLRIRSDLGDGWAVEGTPYTASYFHRGLVGLDPNGTASNLTGRFFVNGVATALVNEVPGRAVHSNFRDWGNILRASKETEWGQARAGLWFDHNAANAYRTNIVLSQGNVPYTRTATATAYDYKYRTGLTTWQPYVEFAARPLPGLQITPGLRYTTSTRDLNAAINQSTKLPAQFSRTYDAVLPSVDARYTFTPDLVGYVQVATGFLAPPLGVLQTTAPQQLNPQQTLNYQVGATWQRDAITLSGDLYWIDFRNRIASQVVSGTTIYFNGGGAIYRGIEAEGTLRLSGGLSLYANGTANDAYYKNSGIRVAATPEKTAAVGPLYDRDGISALLIAKYVGAQYGQDTPVNAYPIKPYTTVDFAAAYTLPILNGRRLDFKLNVNNIFDNHSLIGLNQLASDGKTGLFWTNPGRSVFFSVSASL
ncbi:MAG TPA: TonB-dependent receptor, partial [Acetobacteraceae bacterium]|nr:TonB-dependent receptor [Acetobacteraceae bacterium]